MKGLVAEHARRLPVWVTPATLALIAVLGLGAGLLSATWVLALIVWPVGLATGAIIAAPPRWRPVVAIACGVLAFATVRSFTTGTGIALGFSISVVIQATIGAGILCGGLRSTTHPRLATLRDLRRWLIASFVGPLVSMPLFFAMIIASGVPIRPIAALLVLLASMLSQLVLTLLFHSVGVGTAVIGFPERMAQWWGFAAVTIIVFARPVDAAWAFAIVPVLAWGAVRLPLRKTIVQILGTMVGGLGFAIAGIGPFAIPSNDPSTAAITTAAQLQLFLLSGVLLVVPYAVFAEQLRRSKASAHRERELVRRIMDSATRTAIIATDRSGSITMFSAGAEALLGYRASDVLGRPIELLMPRSELLSQADAVGTSPDFRRIARVLTRGTSEPRDWRLRRHCGEERTHSLSITTLSDPSGEIVGYVCTSEDVTSRVQRQESLLAALANEREAVERLEQADRVKDSLVSTVSHELRTPLTSILGYTTMLLDGDLGDLKPTMHDTLGRIHGNGERLRGLVEDLLVLSRVNAGKLDLTSEPVDLRNVVHAAYDIVAPTLANRTLDIRMRLGSADALVSGDAEMLERVVLNLLANAIKFTPDGGRISVSVRGESDKVVVEVVDSGLGIPLDEQDQLFTQFFRSSIARTEAIQGTGLGLSIAQAIVEQHGGIIGATSEPGTGSTFLVVLPRLVPTRHTQDPPVISPAG